MRSQEPDKERLACLKREEHASDEERKRRYAARRSRTSRAALAIEDMLVATHREMTKDLPEENPDMNDTRRWTSYATDQTACRSIVTADVLDQARRVIDRGMANAEVVETPELHAFSRWAMQEAARLRS